MKSLMDPRVPAVLETADLEFGRRFRYAESFSTSWVEAQIGVTRGRKLSNTVRTIYNDLWRLLDTRYPERIVEWPVWPEARPLHHDDLHFQDCTRTKPLDKEILRAVYSPQAVAIAAKGNEASLFQKAFQRPPLPLDLTWTQHKKRGLKSPDEDWPERAGHELKFS